jgi:phospholipid-binding lipoprotein MlaA
MPDFFCRKGCRLLLLLLLATSVYTSANTLALAADPFGSMDASLPHDPYENWNRKVFAFNETLDAWILKPVATGYRAVTPRFFRTGVRNFFANLGEVSNFTNNLLQAKPAAAGKDAVRFTLNSTVGVLGVFDLATPLGLQKSEEDFGQTLNVWGVPEGPYLVLPFLGGQNLSHSLSMPVDYYLNPMTYIDDSVVYYSLGGLFLVQRRTDLLEAEKLIRGDRYSFIRDAYLQRRAFLVNDGRMDRDPFLDDEDFDFDDEDFAY